MPLAAKQFEIPPGPESNRFVNRNRLLKRELESSRRQSRAPVENVYVPSRYPFSACESESAGGGGQSAVRLYWQRVTQTPGHCYDRALALTGTGVLFRQIDFDSPNATVLVNTLFLADFGSAYVRRTCRVRDVFGRGPIVPDGLELWVAVFATDEGAELTRERTFRIGEKLLGRFSTRDRHSHVFDIDFATAKQVDIQGQRR